MSYIWARGSERNAMWSGMNFALNSFSLLGAKRYSEPQNKMVDWDIHMTLLKRTRANLLGGQQTAISRSNVRKMYIFPATAAIYYWSAFCVSLLCLQFVEPWVQASCKLEKMTSTEKSCLHTMGLV